MLGWTLGISAGACADQDQLPGESSSDSSDASSSEESASNQNTTVDTSAGAADTTGDTNDMGETEAEASTSTTAADSSTSASSSDSNSSDDTSDTSSSTSTDNESSNESEADTDDTSSDSSQTDSDSNTKTSTSGDDSTTDSDSSSESETGADENPFESITVETHDRVQTLQVVRWTQTEATTATRVEFSFENDEWLSSPERELEAGEHREVLLGVPEGLEVSLRLVGERDGTEHQSETLQVTNEMAPMAMPRASIELFEPSKASDDRWLLGEVSEKGAGGYGGPHWFYVIDRAGRIVWYHRPTGGDNGELNQGFWPRIARDGTHITLDRQIRRRNGDLLATTLDFGYEKSILLPEQADCYDMTEDGHVLYNAGSTLIELDPEGDTRDVWECDVSRCYSNTVNWDAATDSVIMSFPYPNTVVQIDRASGEVLRRFGDEGDFSFEPAEQGLDFNHWAHLTVDGTFMVSTHLPDTEIHLFTEYAIDDDEMTLTSKWSYGMDSEDWAQERGMAMRMPGGNVLGNYGPSGVIVEITPEFEVAWRVEFGEHLLGGNFLIDDLYALNRGPESRN